MGEKTGLGLTVLFSIFGAALSDYCTKTKYDLVWGYQTTTTYCPNGCCGPLNYEYCCLSDVGVIAGIVIACIVAVGLIIAGIVCLCKHMGQNNRRTTPNNNQFVQYNPQYPGVATVGGGPQYNAPGAYPVQAFAPDQKGSAYPSYPGGAYNPPTVHQPPAYSS